LQSKQKAIHFARVLALVIPAEAGIQSSSGFRVTFYLPGMTIPHSRHCQPRTRYGATGRPGGLPM
ncbi:MAG TPA: hypothetical protein VK568_08740, partial [Thermodesulfobacteriota bacterium]|nr:hypothetical protein [Thermodesulfobacteriota bacterium]